MSNVPEKTTLTVLTNMQTPANQQQCVPPTTMSTVPNTTPLTVLTNMQTPAPAHHQHRQYVQPSPFIQQDPQFIPPSPFIPEPTWNAPNHGYYPSHPNYQQQYSYPPQFPQWQQYPSNSLLSTIPKDTIPLMDKQSELVDENTIPDTPAGVPIANPPKRFGAQLFNVPSVRFFS